jgi:hypothetical protein
MNGRAVFGRAIITVILAAVLMAPPFVVGESPPTPQQGVQPPEPGMAGMPMQGGETMGGTGQGSERGGQMSRMVCTCPSALHGAGGVVLAILGGILVLATTAALTALTVFLMRRSKRVPAT